jgi:uncharacterized OB-fold protein
MVDPVGELKAVLPQPTAASAPFWDACDRGQLLLPRCRDCRHVFYYPRIMCPKCGGRTLDWLACSGRGRVFSFSQVSVSFYGPDWESQLPYTVVLVDLEEGPRMLSRLTGDHVDRVHIGACVEISFAAIGDRKLPFFRLAAQPGG